MTDTRRDPYDGKPFYCKLCGAGWNEYGACEQPDCELESAAVAELRAQRRRPRSSDSAHFQPRED